MSIPLFSLIGAIPLATMIRTTTHQNIMEHSHETINWQTPEYHYKEKGADWYWALGVITISIATASFMLNNILFAIFIAIGGFTLALYGRRRPSVIQVEIQHRGIAVDKTLYPFSSLASFWVDDQRDPKLVLISKKVLSPYIVIPLGDMDPELIRDVLLEVVQEEAHTEPPTQKIMEYLGF